LRYPLGVSLAPLLQPGSWPGPPRRRCFETERRLAAPTLTPPRV